MNVYNRSTIVAFWRKHANCKKLLELWYNDVTSQNWKSSADVKRSYARASIISRTRVVFDIGDHHRLIADINYQRGHVFIKYVGTHADYDRVDAKSVNLF